MTGSDFLAARERLGWNRRWLARELGYASERSLRQMEAGAQRVPEKIAAWIGRRIRDWNRDPPPKRE